MGFSVFLPLAILFALPFALTLRWYLQRGSAIELFVAAIFQPLFTAAIFAVGVIGYLSMFRSDDLNGIQSFIFVSMAYAMIISVPLSICLCFAGPVQRIYDSIKKERDDRPVSYAKLLAVATFSSFFIAFSAGLVFLMRAS